MTCSRTHQGKDRFHQDNMSMKCITIPLLYSKTGVYRGIPISLIFDPKHRVWASTKQGGSNMYPNQCFEQNY